MFCSNHHTCQEERTRSETEDLVREWLWKDIHPLTRSFHLSRPRLGAEGTPVKCTSFGVLGAWAQAQVPSMCQLRDTGKWFDLSWPLLCCLSNGGLWWKLCLMLCDPVDCSPPGSSIHGYWNGWSFSSPKALPNPGIELSSPVIQVDSLLSKPPGLLGE